MKKWFFIHDSDGYAQVLADEDWKVPNGKELLASATTLSNLYDVIKEVRPDFIGKSSKFKWLYANYKKMGNLIPKNNR